MEINTVLNILMTLAVLSVSFHLLTERVARQVQEIRFWTLDYLFRMEVNSADNPGGWVSARELRMVLKLDHNVRVCSVLFYYVMDRLSDSHKHLQKRRVPKTVQGIQIYEVQFRYVANMP